MSSSPLSWPSSSGMLARFMLATPPPQVPTFVEVNQVVSTAIDEAMRSDEMDMAVRAVTNETALQGIIVAFLRQVAGEWTVSSGFSEAGPVKHRGDHRYRANKHSQHGLWTWLTRADQAFPYPTTFTPDIIIHEPDVDGHRGTNVLAIEMKTSASIHRAGIDEELDKDRDSLLAALASPALSYAYALHLIIRTDGSLAPAFQAGWLERVARDDGSLSVRLATGLPARSADRRWQLVGTPGDVLTIPPDLHGY